MGRVRRQDSVDVLARDDYPRDPRTLAGHVRGGGQSNSDLGSDRRGDGGSEGVAEPGAGAFVRDRLSGRAVCEDAARRAGGEPARCTWPWEWTWRGARYVLGLWTSSNEGAKFWLG